MNRTININIFSAYSTRHAATSSAYRIEVLLGEIRKMAGWSETSNVFARFYNRPLSKAALTRSINIVNIIIVNILM